MSKKRKNSAQRRFDRVRDAFDPQALIEICEMPQSAFAKYGERVDLDSAKGWRGSIHDNFYFYRDNGARVLAVAHLDNVQDDRTTTITETLGGPVVFSGALDDRLGAYVILDLLPKLGVKVDVLLTTNEEIGASSAEYFETEKQYNWIIEFDRGGTDVVMYQYETPILRDLVYDTSGAHVGMGSYSDIADLEHLGAVGFNWGVGYHDYHSERSHAWLNDTFTMVSKFMRFYAANAATYLEHFPTPRFSADGLTYDDATGTYSWVGGGYREQYEAITSDGVALSTQAANRSLDADAEEAEEVVFELCPVCDSETGLDKDGICWDCGYGVIISPKAAGGRS